MRRELLHDVIHLKRKAYESTPPRDGNYGRTYGRLRIVDSHNTTPIESLIPTKCIELSRPQPESSYGVTGGVSQRRPILCQYPERR